MTTQSARSAGRIVLDGHDMTSAGSVFRGVGKGSMVKDMPWRAMVRG